MSKVSNPQSIPSTLQNPSFAYMLNPKSGEKEKEKKKYSHTLDGCLIRAEKNAKEKKKKKFKHKDVFG
ncbi:MAG: hypothetical protein HRT68_14505 [Flavobacteriaceae bacterium]|nr:hypothetical protein [Flavobacteriaceae bacterium]